MKSKKNNIKIVSWEEVKGLVSKKNTDVDFLNAINAIYDKQENTKKYCFLAEFEFGVYLINKGKIDFANLELIENNNFKTNLENDLHYTEDPLGLVLDGQIELFFENNSNDTHTYKVPITTIKTGNLFGTYGTLDFKFNIKYSSKSRNWFAVSGSGNNIWVATSLHTNADSELLEELQIKFFSNKKKIEIDKWNLFLNKYLNNITKTKVIYFPKHLIEEIFKNINNPLIKIAWEQTLELRGSFLKDNTVTNKILGHSIKYFHKEYFIIEFYDYLVKVTKGEAQCLLPIKKNTNHIIKEAFTEFKKKSKKSKLIGYVPFEYGKLDYDNNFGILLLPMLPLKNDYKQDSLKKLIKDLFEISKIQEPENKLMDFVLGCQKKNQIKPEETLHKYVIEHKVFIKSYLCQVNEEYSNANFGSAEFSSFIIINKR